MTPWDAVVVGAGPAGSATATVLARAGARVLLMDRARFPRPKPCAEYVSPKAVRALDRLGVLAAVRAAGPAVLRGMRVVSADGTSFTGRFPGPRGPGLALPRERLDALLLAGAVRAGAAVHEQVAFDRFTRNRDGTLTVRARTAGGSPVGSRTRLLIGADGLNSRVAARLGLARRGRRRWLALTSHAVNVAGVHDVGEMHVTRDAYVGLAPVGGGLTNVAAVVRLGTRPRERPTPWLARTIARIPEVRARLREATFVTPVRAVGPFGRTTSRARADGVLLVGDAADFYDPFTGEGIYAALRGAELAAPYTLAGLERGALRARDLAGYDRDRLRTFGGKWIMERVIGLAVAVPPLLNHVARRLARHGELADLLVGVTGDGIPAHRVLRPAVLWQMMAP